jgi:hypothetical protein
MMKDRLSFSANIFQILLMNMSNHDSQSKMQIKET